MTIRIEPPSWPDKILAVLGKKRALCFPTDMDLGAYQVAKREGFLAALIRPQGKPLPKGWSYWDDELVQ